MRVVRGVSVRDCCLIVRKIPSQIFKVKIFSDFNNFKTTLRQPKVHMGIYVCRFIRFCLQIIILANFNRTLHYSCRNTTFYPSRSLLCPSNRSCDAWHHRLGLCSLFLCRRLCRRLCLFCSRSDLVDLDLLPAYRWLPSTTSPRRL